jgi:acetyl-CoA acyltransferase
MSQVAYIVSAQRTPVGKAFKGAFAHTRPDDLLVHCIQSVMKTLPKIDPKEIADVIIGCAMPEAEQGMNIARIAALLADLPDSIPGMTVNRFCSSGVQTVALAAQQIQLGLADLIMAGGTESMSMVPMGGNKYSNNPKIFTDNEHIGIAYGMGITAERVAQAWKISREAQDRFALQSHERALAAIASGAFQAEISPFWVNSRFPNLKEAQVEVKRSQVLHDEGPRADTNLAALQALKPVFALKGSVTAGNSSQMSDGAAALVLASEAAVKRYQLTPLAIFHGFAVAGVPPEHMGIGPVLAIPKLLKQQGLTLQDIDWIELNEAFAAQSLAVIQELNLDPAKVNPLGGAIALGHPLGATGAIRTATLAHGLKRTRKRYGIVTMCVGTGMGAAGLIERC